MVFLKKLFRFYVYSNLHVAVAVACLTMSVGFLFRKNVTHEAFLLMAATFVSYHLIRFLNKHKYSKKHLLATFNNHYQNPLLVLIVFFTIFGFWELLYLRASQIFCLLCLGSITLLYAFDLIGFKNTSIAIRFVPVVKIFVIAFVWSGAVLFFPLVSVLSFHVNYILYFFGLLLFVIALTIPFDIRDLDFDDKSLKTLPMILGLVGVKTLGIVCLIASLGIHIFVFKRIGLWQFCVVCTVLAFLLIFSKKQQSKYYASFWVESLPILYYTLLVCG